ncbi:MAG: formate dehydrogenase [Betaproteobacteria bacterium]|nr:formate dehydrogenase [Betaproteobacteria bacterium]NBY72332.1 formate dehydrogenase [Betaproteobacteria bacterium]
MDIDNLVTMANSIGDFFQSMPNPQEARHGIAQHISKFWEPRMREALISHLAEASSSQLHPLVREAIQEHLELLATKKVVARA